MMRWFACGIHYKKKNLEIISFKCSCIQIFLSVKMIYLLHKTLNQRQRPATL